MKDNYKIFGFKNIESYEDFLNIMKNKVIYERKQAGFLDDINDNNLDADLMIEKTLELEVYNKINKHLKYNNFNEAWQSIISDNHLKEKINENNELKYKNMFKKIFYKMKNKLWSPFDLLTYIKNEERKIKKAVISG